MDSAGGPRSSTSPRSLRRDRLAGAPGISSRRLAALCLPCIAAIAALAEVSALEPEADIDLHHLDLPAAERAHDG